MRHLLLALALLAAGSGAATSGAALAATAPPAVPPPVSAPAAIPAPPPPVAAPVPKQASARPPAALATGGGDGPAAVLNGFVLREIAQCRPLPSFERRACCERLLPAAACVE